MQSSVKNSTHFMAQGRLVLVTSLLGICATSMATGQTSTINKNSLGAKQLASSATQVAPKSQTEFLRIRRDDSGQPLALQTAITRFRPTGNDTIVDLIGAVHIGEGEYYETLNRQFELYDVVLYELVAPQGTRIPKGGKRATTNPLSMLQRSAQNLLGLESQLAHINYEKTNFVHADMSPAEITEKMRERGDSPFTIGLSVFSDMMRNQNRLAKQMNHAPASAPQGGSGSETLFELLGNPLKLKTMMAQQFTQTGTIESGLGATLNRLLVVDRNAAALKVLEKELAKGHQKIAIFYGAAHMPDFERRLAKDFRLNRTQQVWLDAWDLTHTSKSSQSKPTQMLFQMLKQLEK